MTKKTHTPTTFTNIAMLYRLLCRPAQQFVRKISEAFDPENEVDECINMLETLYSKNTNKITASGICAIVSLTICCNNENSSLVSHVGGTCFLLALSFLGYHCYERETLPLYTLPRDQKNKIIDVINAINSNYNARIILSTDDSIHHILNIFREIKRELLNLQLRNTNKP